MNCLRLPQPRFQLLIGLLFPLILIAGCWDRRELDELAIVLGMAIDASEKPGEYIVTYRIANPRSSGMPGGGSSGDGGSSQDSEFFIVSAHGSSIVDANREIQRRLSRQLFFSQVQVIHFGEDVARQGVGPLLDFLERNGQLRRTMWVTVVKGEARNSFKPSAAPIEVAADVEGTLDMGPKNGVVTVLFGDFLERLGNPGAAAIATATEMTEEGGKLSGTAVFSADRLIGFLDTEASLGLGIALGQIRAGTLLIDRGSDPSDTITTVFRIQQISGRLEPTLQDGRFHMTIHVDVQSVLEEQTATDHHVFTITGWEDLENMQAALVRRLIHSALEKAQAWQTDVFRFGNVFARAFPKQWADVEDRWTEVFPTVTVSIEVKSNVWQAGLITKRVPLR